MLEPKLESFLTEKFKELPIPPEVERRIFEEKKKSGKRFIEIIEGLPASHQREPTKLLAEFYQIPFLDLDTHPTPDPEALKLIPEKLIRAFKALPVARVPGGILTIAMADPTDVVLVDRLGQYAKCDVASAFATSASLDQAIERILGPLDTLGRAIRGVQKPKAEPAGGSSESVIEAAGAHVSGTAQTVNIVNLIIEKAIESRASDIHLEPGENEFYVRYRIDGVLYDYKPQLPKSMEAPMISRLKIMANLDIAEKRLPQDGRISYRAANREINLRLSTFPTIYGENVVIRVLDKTDTLFSLEQIGLRKEMLQKFRSLANRAYGMILVTGPTGSGKTTTLYAALSEINSIERHIITLEDPVEYRLERVRQSQIDPKSGLTFARGLRSMMRQDPDVIMVGEIRDLETAQIAIQAALTGHLVLSTLHTNDASSAVTRLVDMGMEPFLISSSLLCVVAQRLLRTLCRKCKKAYRPPDAILKEIFRSGEGGGAPEKSIELYERAGCDECKQTGFQGRIGVFEMLVPNDEIRKLIVKNESAEVIKKEALRQGMQTLKQNGLEKAIAGLTSLEEVLRVTQEF